jgi:hypothetical protein
MSDGMPIYVTRPHGANKTTASYSLSLWMSILAMMLVWMNVVLWGVFGIVAVFWLSITAVW